MPLDSVLYTVLAVPQDTGGVLVQVDPGTVADNVWVFDIAGEKWRRITDGPYRAAWVVNGVTDQTSRLQAVFNHADVSEVVFDDGDVTVNGTLTIPAGKKITFLGSGRIVTTGVATINGGVYRFKRAEFFGAGVTANEELVYTTGGGGSSSYTGSILLIPLATPVLTATVVNSTEIGLAWTNVANESSFRLEYSTTGVGGWVQIGGTIPANTLAYAHTGLAPGITYYYRLTAVGDNTTYGASDYATDNETTTPLYSFIDWINEVNISDSGSGTLAGLNTTAGGARANTRLAKANGNYVEFIQPSPIANGNGISFLITTVYDTYFTWDGSLSMIVGVDAYNGDYSMRYPTPITLYSLATVPVAGDIIRLEVSGDDILVRRSTDGGLNYTTLGTKVGALTAITDIYIKAIFALNSTSHTILSARGVGLVAV